MPSTFFGLYIGESGLSTYQTAINTTANNVANTQTKGYSRQQVAIEAARSLRVNLRYGSVGSGVTASSIEQVRNMYYDLKYWNANAKLGECTTKQDYLAQIENYFTDSDSVDGFTTIFSKMYANLETLNSQASQYSARQTFISSAQSLGVYFNAMSEDLTTLQEELNQVIYTDVDKINSIAIKVSSINKQINIIEQQGTEASELRDERALLVDELSALVPVEVSEDVVSEESGATRYRLDICGHALVDTYEYHQLACIPREEKVNQSDAEGLYDIYWLERNGDNSGVRFEPNTPMMTGELKGLFAVRDGNNGENFQGTVDGFLSGVKSDGKEYQIVRIKSPNIRDISMMSMNDEGTILLGSTRVGYDDFECYYDETTGEYTYYFYLTDDVSTGDMDKLYGKSASVGQSIEYMGIPYYQAQLNGFLRTFASAFNDLELSGLDHYGDEGQILFTGKAIDGGQYAFTDREALDDTTGLIRIMSSEKDTYYKLTASNVEISDALVKNPYLLACRTNSGDGSNASDIENSDLVDSLYALCTEEKIFRNISADSFLQCIISDISVDVQEANIFTTNYTNVVDAIIAQRTSVSGVDEDEEALDLIKYQNAYNLSSKVIQVLSEVYDRLILSTGV